MLTQEHLRELGEQSISSARCTEPIQSIQKCTIQPQRYYQAVTVAFAAAPASSIRHPARWSEDRAGRDSTASLTPPGPPSDNSVAA